MEPANYGQPRMVDRSAGGERVLASVEARAAAYGAQAIRDITHNGSVGTLITRPDWLEEVIANAYADGARGLTI